MQKGFTEYVGTCLPNKVNLYRILTYIETETNVGKIPVLYHKYRHSSLMKFLNWLGSKNITNKEYFAHNEMVGEEFVGMTVRYGVFKAAGFAFNLFKRTGGSIWKLPGWDERGFVYEKMMGGNLVKNFPVIDKFLKGVATSIKTLDLKAAIIKGLY